MPINKPTSLHETPAKGTTKNSVLSRKTMSSQSQRAAIQKKIGAGSNPQEIVERLLSEAPSELDKAHVIYEAQVNTSEAALKYVEVVAIFHEKAEKQERWKLLGIDRNKFNRQIQYKDNVAPAITAFRKIDAR